MKTDISTFTVSLWLALVKIYLSNMAYTWDEGWWIVQMMVLPWAANCCSAVTKLCAMNESRPEVGSSANNSGGSVMTYMVDITWNSETSANRTSLDYLSIDMTWFCFLLLHEENQKKTYRPLNVIRSAQKKNQLTREIIILVPISLFWNFQ